MAKKTGKNLPTLDEEALLWNKSGAFVFGVDEAGRGCLAGPVCAAVACWAPFTAAFGLPVPVRDSKLMTHDQREAAFTPVQSGALASGVGFASAAEIDEWNILRANHLAVARALEVALAKLIEHKFVDPQRLAGGPFAFLSDGSHPLVAHAKFFVQNPRYQRELPLVAQVLRQPVRERCVVKGDSKVFSIASASVLAKVSRDRRMVSLHEEFPQYEFAAHKGYSTARHIELLRASGPCREHRKSFAPVREALRAPESEKPNTLFS